MSIAPTADDWHHAWRRLGVNPLPRHLLQLEQESAGGFWRGHSSWALDLIVILLPAWIVVALALGEARGWLWIGALLALPGLPLYLLGLMRVIFESVANTQEVLLFSRPPTSIYERPQFEGAHRLRGADVVLGLALHVAPRAALACIRAAAVHWLLLASWTLSSGAQVPATVGTWLSLGLPAVALVGASGMLAALILALYLLVQIRRPHTEPDYVSWVYGATVLQGGFTLVVLLGRDRLVQLDGTGGLITALVGSMLLLGVMYTGLALTWGRRWPVLRVTTGSPVMLSLCLGVALLLLLSLASVLLGLPAALMVELCWPLSAFMLINPLALPGELLRLGGLEPGALHESWRLPLLALLQVTLLTMCGRYAARRVDSWRRPAGS